MLVLMDGSMHQEHIPVITVLDLLNLTLQEIFNYKVEQAILTVHGNSTKVELMLMIQVIFMFQVAI